MAKFLCVGLSPTIQKTVTFKNVQFGTVNRAVSYRLDASGKAVNSARVLNQLETSCANVVCPLGVENRDLFLRLASDGGLSVESVEIPGFTRECLTLLNSLDSTTTELVVDEPVCDFDCEEKESRILTLIKKNLPCADGVLVAGSRPACWSSGLIPYIAKMISAEKKIFVADYHGADLTGTLDVCVPTAVKINRDEFISTFRLPLYTSDEDLKNAVIQKSREFHTIFAVTRGSCSTYCADDGDFLECPSEQVSSAVNTTACGDSFSAGFLYEYVHSNDVMRSLSKGTWCAARNAEREIPGSIR